MPPTYQERLRAIPRAILFAPFLLCLAPVVIVCIYWWITYTGLYQWIAELQVRAGAGGYRPVATGFITLAVSLIIAVLPAAVPSLLLGFVLVKLNVFPVNTHEPAATEPKGVVRKRSRDD
jgi:hypothetical protein